MEALMQPYHNAMLVTWTIMFVMGFVLVVYQRTPRSALYRPYRTASKLLGALQIVIGVQMWTHWFFLLRENFPHYVTAFNLAFYYAESLLVGLVFIPLFDGRYLTWRRVRWVVAKWTVFVTVGLAALFFMDRGAARATMFAGIGIYIIDAMCILRDFVGAYRRALERLHDEQIRGAVRWTRRGAFALLFFGVAGAILSFMPVPMQVLYLCSLFFTHVYVFASFINYAINSKTVEYILLDATAAEGDKMAERAIEEWVGAFGYCKPNITLQGVCRDLGVSRRQFIAYVKSRGSENVSEWVARLRIAYAKDLMETTHLNLERIARRSGFSGGSYFSVVFKKYEGVSPVEYRRMLQERGHRDHLDIPDAEI